MSVPQLVLVGAGVGMGGGTLVGTDVGAGVCTDDGRPVGGSTRVGSDAGIAIGTDVGAAGVCSSA